MKKLYRIKIGDINITEVRRNIGEDNISSSEERELEELNDPVWVDIGESSDGIQKTSGKQPEPKFKPGEYLTNHKTGLTQWTEYHVDAAFTENEESRPKWRYILTKCVVTTIIDRYDARKRSGKHTVAEGTETHDEDWLLQNGFRKKRMRKDSYLWKKWGK